MILNGFAGSATRPDIDVLVSSGLFDQMLSALRAFERAGVEGVQTTDIGGMYHVLGILRKSMSHPACKAKIRGVGSSLAFAMEHSLDLCEEIGWTTGSSAAALCKISHQYYRRTRINLSQSRCGVPDMLLTRRCIRCVGRLRGVRPRRRDL